MVIRAKPKPKPKPKGVTKQQKAAATRAGFSSVAAYRKAIAEGKAKKPSSLTSATKGRTDKEIADNLGITVKELLARRKASLTKSVQEEAKTTGKTVAEVKEARKKRSIKTPGSKRAKTAKKRAFSAKKIVEGKKEHKDRIKNIKSQIEAGKSISKEDRLFWNKSLETVPQYFSLGDVHIRPEPYVLGARSIRPSEDAPKAIQSKPAFKPVSKGERMGSGKPKGGLSTLREVEAKPIPPSEKAKLSEKLPKSVKTVIVSEQKDSLPASLRKRAKSKEESSKKLIEEIHNSLVKQGVPKNIANKIKSKMEAGESVTGVTGVKGLSTKDINKLKKAGVGLVAGKPGSARAVTPQKKQTERDRLIRKVTGDPIPEKWKQYPGIQKLLGVEVSTPKRTVGKVGQGKGKLFPGNVTPSQIADILGMETKQMENLSAKDLKNLEAHFKNLGLTIKKSGGVVRRKTGGQIKRGTGAALRGFGKATYSHKLY
jgi:hypothetical protein